MSKELVQQLKDLKRINDQLTPDRVWVEQNRAALLSQIQAEATPVVVKQDEGKESGRWAFLSHLSIFVPKSFGYLRPALTVFVALGVLTSGWIATASAKLGDAFYPVKIAAEKTQVALVSVVGDESAKAKLHLDLAAKRAEEVKESVKTKASASPEAQKKLVDAEKKAMDSLQASLNKSKEIVRTVSETNPGKAADLLKETHVQTEAIVGSLKEMATAAKQTAPELSENIAKTTKEVREVKLETIQAVLEKNTENEAVKTIAVEAIDAAVRDVATAAASSTERTLNMPLSTPEATSTPAISPTTTTQVKLEPTAVSTSIASSSSISRVLQQGTTSQPVSTPELIQALDEAKTLTATAPSIPSTQPVQNSPTPVPAVKSETVSTTTVR